MLAVPIETLTDRSEGRAIAPVLGTALLIAITVILSGVVGFIVLGVDTGANSAPNAELSFSQSTNASAKDVTVVHEGGDILPADDVSVVITDNSGDDSDTGSFTEDMSGGDAQQIVADSVERSDVVRLVWNDPNSDKTAVLGEYTVE